VLLALLCVVPSADAQLFSGSTPFTPSGSGNAPTGGGPAGPGGGPAGSDTAPIVAADGPAPEFRGLWVDAYREGFKSPEQVDRLLLDARRANINALLVQVRKRGDALYLRSL